MKSLILKFTFALSAFTVCSTAFADFTVGQVVEFPRHKRGFGVALITEKAGDAVILRWLEEVKPLKNQR